jgi:hypothetical protein
MLVVGFKAESVKNWSSLIAVRDAIEDVLRFAP